MYLDREREDKYTEVNSTKRFQNATLSQLLYECNSDLFQIRTAWNKKKCRLRCWNSIKICNPIEY
jgi:hypothetical protein